MFGWLMGVGLCTYSQSVDDGTASSLVPENTPSIDMEEDDDDDDEEEGDEGDEHDPVVEVVAGLILMSHVPPIVF